MKQNLNIKIAILVLISFALKANASTQKDSVEIALSLPLTNRIEALTHLGEPARIELEKNIFNTELPMDIRWRSITSLSMAFGGITEPVILKASKSKDWYIRNAAVIAAKYCSREFAIELSKQLLKDKALVVRTAAVSTLNSLKAYTAKEDLWNELYANINFDKGRSLWVRKNISNTLVQFATVADEGKFVKMLNDQDEEVRKSGQLGLAKIKKIAGPDYQLQTQSTSNNELQIIRY